MKQQFKQIAAIIRSAWIRQINFRFTIISYRVGEILEILVLIMMWTAIYAGGSSGMIKGFTLNEMITYVLVGSLCTMAVRNFLASYISRDIIDGRLSMFLVKPISYIKFVFFNELGRTGLVTCISVISQILVISFFMDKVIFNTDPAYLGLILLMIFLAFVIEWQINFLIGTIAFWTDEIDGLQTSIDRIKRFFSGGYFPLSLLPVTAATIGTFLPFAYSFFVPAQLYLKKIDLRAGLIGICIQIAWIAALTLIIRIVWKKGLRKYEASGS